MRWVMAPIDPKVLNAAMQALNPNTYLQMATATASVPTDPRVANMATAPVNPNWYAGWMNTAVAPSSYGPTVGNWFNPAAMPTMPALPTFPGFPAMGYPTPGYPAMMPAPR
jgi:hypothetical protein